MGKRVSLGVSPTGVQHSVEIDNDGDSMSLIEHTPGHIESEILDSCARLRGLQRNKTAALQHAARIPINTYQQWRKEWKEKYSKVYTWPTFEVMKLNSRDNCKMRTGGKRGVYGKKL